MMKKSLIATAALACALGASAQTSINLANYQLSGNFALDTLGGIGLEASAVTYARDRGTLNFATGSSTMASLFDANLLGLNSLSDIQTLSPVDALAGSAAADNLLILSLDSRRLVEVNRAGQILSFFDLSVVTNQAIEGVTVDEFGTIYLVAEDSGTPDSRLFVLSAVGAVPEPETCAQMLGGLGLMAWVARLREAGTHA